MIPVVDISEHQGAVDFRLMRDRGVRGLILRASHGQTRDARASSYYPAAVGAGFAPYEIGWYSFINPKRGNPGTCAAATASIIESIAGRASFVMVDAESYILEPPSVGLAPVTGEEYGDYCETFAEVIRLRLDCPVIGYSNAAFWNSFVGDHEWPARVDWIVPRYPAYSQAAYASRPLPVSASGWASWAESTVQGPIPPKGARGWQGWQFSAGHNRQGAHYGCQSRDLDLNIVRDDAWLRWTDRTPVAPVEPKPSHPVEDDMVILTNAEAYGDTKPREQKWALMDDGTRRHLSPLEWRLRGAAEGVELPWSELNTFPIHES